MLPVTTSPPLCLDCPSASRACSQFSHMCAYDGCCHKIELVVWAVVRMNYLTERAAEECLRQGTHRANTLYCPPCHYRPSINSTTVYSLFFFCFTVFEAHFLFRMISICIHHLRCQAALEGLSWFGVLVKDGWAAIRRPLDPFSCPVCVYVSLCVCAHFRSPWRSVSWSRRTGAGSPLRRTRPPPSG